MKTAQEWEDFFEDWASNAGYAFVLLISTPVLVLIAITYPLFHALSYATRQYRIYNEHRKQRDKEGDMYGFEYKR